MNLNLNFDPFPVLQTSRLTLRKPLLSDAPALFRLRSDDSVLQYLDRPKMASLDEAREFIEKIHDNLDNNNSINWAITPKDTNELIGTIGFWRIETEHYRAEIGYMLFPEYQRRGLMQEALSEVIAFGFNTLNLHSVEANCNPANVASILLLEKNNFVKEAYFKENYYFAGKFLDSVIFSLVNTNPTITK